MDILWAIVIGVVAGWLAGLLVKGRGFGFVGDLVVGAIGEVVGTFLFRAVGITPVSTLGVLGMALAGAVVFLTAVKVLKHA